MTERRSDENPLSPFLEETTEAGQYDSTGVFTTSVGRGLEMLASYQLAPPSAWILKVVQAAVAWGAQELTVRQSATRTSFAFAHGVRPFPLFELQQALLSTDPSPVGSVEHLTAGLRSVGQGDGRTWRLTNRTGDSSEQLVWDGQELSRTGESHARAAEVILEVDFTQADRGRRLGRLFRGAGRARDEYMEVVKGAYVCPIPLTFDGRRIDSGEHRGSFEKETRLAYLCFGVAPPDKLAQSPEIGLPAGVKRPVWRATDRFSDGHLFSYQGDPEQAKTQAFWQLHFHYKVDSFIIPGFDKKFAWKPVNGPSQCHWVRDGVVCQSTALAFPEMSVSLDLYLSAGDLATDLSGLAVVASEANLEAMALRQRQALRLVRNSIHRTRTALGKHLSLPSAAHLAYFGPAAALFVWGAVVTTPVLLFMGVAGIGPLMVISALDKKKLVTHCVRALGSLAGQIPD